MLVHGRLAWHSFLARKSPVTPYPRVIQIEPTTRCNLRCSMCSHREWQEEHGDLTLADFKTLIDRFDRLLKVDLTGIGEALLNKDFISMIRYLKTKRIFVTFTDNFTLLNQEVARRLIASGVDQITLSLDAASKAAYERTRQGAKFERVLENIEGFIEQKKELRTKLPAVKINCVVTEDNRGELTELVELAHKLGIRWINFTDVQIFNDLPDVKAQDRIFAEVRQRAGELGIEARFSTFDKQPFSQCRYPWVFLYVTLDGYAHPCCWVRPVTARGEQNRYNLGNLLKQDLRSLWRGRECRELRDRIAESRPSRYCSNCLLYEK